MNAGKPAIAARVTGISLGSFAAGAASGDRPLNDTSKPCRWHRSIAGSYRSTVDCPAVHCFTFPLCLLHGNRRADPPRVALRGRSNSPQLNPQYPPHDGCRMALRNVGTLMV